MQNPWQEQGHTPRTQTLAMLTKLGYSITQITDSIGVCNGNITNARKQIGLGPSTASRVVLLENMARKKGLRNLTQAEAAMLLKAKGLTENLAEKVQALLALPSETQQIFALATRLEAKAKEEQQKAPSYSALAKAVQSDPELNLKIDHQAVRRALDKAREVLQIEQTAQERYSGSAAREIHNERVLKERDKEFSKFPGHENPHATEAEIQRARVGYRKLRNCRMQRAAYTYACRYPDKLQKEIMTIMEHELGLDMNKNYEGALREARQALGISTVAGQKKTQIAAAKKLFKEKIPKKLPKLGAKLRYSNFNAAQKVWGDKDSETRLTSAEKAAFYAYATASTEESDIKLRATQAVDMRRVVSIYEEFTGLRDIVVDSLAASIRRARVKLGMQASDMQEKQQALAELNKKASNIARQLPKQWRLGGNRVKRKSKLADVEAQKRFVDTTLLTPTDRIFFTLCVELATQNKPAEAKNVLAYALSRAKKGVLPEHLNEKSVSAILRKCRDVLEFA